MKFKFLITGFIMSMFAFSSLSNFAHAGLISFWELSSDYSDSSGNGHHGSGFGNVLPSFSSEAPANINGSVTFNNRNYIALNQYFRGDNSVAEISVSAWFKTSSSFI